MKWLLTVLAILVGVLLVVNVKLANVKLADNSPEALRVMAELREALQRCDATKRPDALEAPALAPAPAPTFEDARRPNEERTRKSAIQRCVLEAERLGRAPALWCAGL